MTQTDDARELKPCPFCGGKAEIEQYGDNRISTIVACTECGCRLENGEAFRHGTFWNTRADLAPTPLDDPRVRAMLALLKRAQDIIDPCHPRSHGDWQKDTRAALAAFDKDATP